MDNINPRSIILDILIEINENNKYSNVVLSDALKKYQYLDHADRAFISRCVMGLVERKITVDYIIDAVSKVKTARMKPVIRNILRMSVYQIMYMDNSKEYAICNEAVKLAAKRGFFNLKGFVNGVLRNIIRQKNNILKDAGEDIIYSTPLWIVNMMQENYGSQKAEAILKAQFEDRPLSVRCNMALNTPDELMEKLSGEGVTVKKSGIIDEALFISGYDYLDKLKSFREGRFFVQDVSSMLVAHIADPEKGSYVVDVCAAPGGKSLHMAELVGDEGVVSSRDISDYKVSKIDENIAALGIKNIKTKVWDATITDKTVINKADVVIADLPCSGLGILNKKPDIKYNASWEGCKQLAAIQRKILACAADYVKCGGILMYSTCTLNREENVQNLKWFVDNYPFKQADISDRVPDLFRKESIKDGYVEILPGVDSGYCDGFFIAKLIRE